MIDWKPVHVKLKDLKPWERNPRQIGKRAAKRLLESWEEFGQVQTIAVGPEGEVYDGHQRLSVLKAAYGDEHEVIALQSSRALSDEEREKLVLLLHAGSVGVWNWDELANWGEEVLKSFGLDDELLAALRRDEIAIKELLKSGLKENPYVSFANPPTYEPAMPEPPAIAELYDDSKASELLQAIEESDLPDDLKHFLRLAAIRHVRFDFGKIAEYYAHASPDVQEFFEQSALVIVDYDDAIAHGFLRMTEKIRQLYEKDHGRRKSNEK